ncbi:MAG: hypothetical protein ACI9QL_000192 [Candidatus Omnitrophota bacterium]
MQEITMRCLSTIITPAAVLLGLTLYASAKPPEPYQWVNTFDIPGIEDDASGVTWSPITRNLYVIIDGPERIVELTPEGQALRQIKLKGFEDTEGICHIRENLFAVVEEEEMTVTFVDLSKDVLSVSAKEGRVIRVGQPLPKDARSGLEGISYDVATDTLYVVREADPKEVYTIHDASSAAPRVAPAPLLLKAVDALDDLSDILYSADEKLLYIISDRSKAFVRIRPDGSVLDQLSLKKDHLGLKKTIKDAEGITRDHRGYLFICSEPRQIHVFAPTTLAKP